jgi:hypothetical protein
MAKSTGFVGRGTIFEIANTGGPPVTYATVANVEQIQLDGREVSEIDFTHLLSVDGYRESRPGLKEAGTITLTLHFDPGAATHNGTRGIQQLYDDGTTFSFRINFTDAGEAYGYTGEGFIQAPGNATISNEDPVRMDVTIRITGPLDLVAIP